jgi:hypothetical protein
MTLVLPDGADAVSVCWATAMAHLWGLHSLYLTAGHSRVTERLSDMARDISTVLVRRGLCPSFLGHAVEAAFRVHEIRGPLIATSEAGWWAVVAQASFALSAWYGLSEKGDEDAESAAKLHRAIRAGIQCMFGDGPSNRLLDAATGDGAGDLLKLVAQVHIGLELTHEQ